MHIRFFFVLLLSGILTAGVIPTEALGLSGTEPEEPAAGDSPLGATVDSTPRIETALPSPPPPPPPPPRAETPPGTSLPEVPPTDPPAARDATGRLQRPTPPP